MKGYENHAVKMQEKNRTNTIIDKPGDGDLSNPVKTTPKEEPRTKNQKTQGDKAHTQ